jgi:DNA repair photolyase
MRRRHSSASGRETAARIAWNAQLIEPENIVVRESVAESPLRRVAPLDRGALSEWALDPYVVHSIRTSSKYLPSVGTSGTVDREVVVYVNVLEVLEKELSTSRPLPKRVIIGTEADPYQFAEERYELMPSVIRALAAVRIPFSVITGSELIQRDLDLLVRAARRTRVEPEVSIATLDDGLLSRLDPDSSTAEARLATIRAIRGAGLPCAVRITPVLPLLTDSDEILERLVRETGDAGATTITITPLYRLSPVRHAVLEWIREHDHRLQSRYREIYETRSSTPTSYRQELLTRSRRILENCGFTISEASTDNWFSVSGMNGPTGPKFTSIP